MEHLYAEYGDKVYQTDFFTANEKAKEKEIIAWCEDNEINLNAKAKAKLLSTDTWLNCKLLVEFANKLAETITQEYNDYNLFNADVEARFKAVAPEILAEIKPNKRKAFYTTVVNSVSWYNENAEKVVKKVVKFKQDKLDEILHHLGCEQTDLADFGYFATANKNEFTTYEPNSDLRDAESVPLNYNQETNTDNSQIHQYFLDEVQPHVAEAWINLDSTKIGYEISFNKYFYQHKPLRSMGEVAIDIINLEQKSEGLIADILGVDLAKVQGE